MNRTVDILAVIFVIVSVTTFSVQSITLSRLLVWPVLDTETGTLVHRGLVRTSICRVAAAAVYVTASTTIWLNQDALPVLSLTVYILVQLLWILNAVADVRLRRKLALLA